ncbi:TPA: LysR substrate-binding domain-containing protein [Bacillus cereus]|uniref:HTH-type transcriptional regulator CzcR n=1 Tax=Bacillus cereus 03BB108 TaxID=451709 RepID=A0AAN0STD2_BACCE|nr:MULTISPECIES: LysR family transcriptional regulator [Bacillus cereus group]MRD08080.1 LysR family transcriptional regulator [Bacillus thuringiensis]AEW54828.1 transcriptional regulator, LysR family [Bacillus cereus F837/76]AJI10010.1 bacterial regulatory helix-turn-helix, lysR family protein [Bacillus cereus 03BB108]EDX62731.1 transcriptional regulator, LysR family [Bacillus cereus 03BB108]MBL3766163.1 LysR family transcriptional regulator [Bacillus cereus]
MNLLKLEIVVLIKKYKKLTIVAEKLGVKQPTITFHIKSLEEELGVSLLELRSGRYFLTEAGEALHHYACKIDALMKEARRVTQEFKDFHKGAITIGASYVPATYLLPEIVYQFQCEFPNIKITLMVKTAPEIRTMLQNHEIDLGVISAAPFDESLLKQTNVMPDTLVLAFSKEHHFSKKENVSLQDIEKERILLHRNPSTTRDLLTKWMLAHNITFQSEIELDSLETMKQILKYGNGVAFISKLAIEQEVQRNELRYIPIPEFEFQRNIYTIHHEDRWNSKIISFLLQSITSYAEKS